MSFARRPWFAAWLPCAALIACTSAAPPPSVDKPEITPAPPVDKPEIEVRSVGLPRQPQETPAEPEPERKPEPEPEPEPDYDKTPYPPGIVPEHEELLGMTFEKATAEHKPDPPLLARADKCMADPNDCRYPVGVLGFHKDGRIAVIEAPDKSSCGDEYDPLTRVWGRVGKEDAFKSAPKVRFKPSEDDERGARVAATFISDQVKAGFEAPAEIVVFTGGMIHEIRGITTLAGLKAPLAGWMVHVIGDGKVATVRLVDPDNKVAHVLGKVPSKKREPSLEQVLLNPARTHMLITLSHSDGTHCGTDLVAIHRWPLPAGVTPTP